MKFHDFIQPGSKYDTIGAKKVFDFLAEPANIHNLVIFSELNLPALSGLVFVLEEKFGNEATFPLTDFRNRQLVGRMTKYILDFYGYTPCASGLGDKTQLKGFTRAKLFKTAACYSLTKEPQLELVIQSKVLP